MGLRWAQAVTELEVNENEKMKNIFLTITILKIKQCEGLCPSADMLMMKIRYLYQIKQMYVFCFYIHTSK